MRAKDVERGVELIRIGNVRDVEAHVDRAVTHLSERTRGEVKRLLRRYLMAGQPDKAEVFWRDVTKHEGVLVLAAWVSALALRAILALLLATGAVGGIAYLARGCG